jgi:hypothetical protein
MTTEKKPELFPEAEARWDLERLLDDLAEINGEPLTTTEQLTLRGLLCGYTPAELAEVRVKDKRGQQTNVSRGVRRYVKKLMRVKGVEVPERLNSVKMLALLKKAGYKKPLTALQNEGTLPIKALEGVAKVIGVNKVIGINNEVTFVRLTSLTAEEVIKMLTGSVENGGKEKE